MAASAAGSTPIPPLRREALDRVLQRVAGVPMLHARIIAGREGSRR